MQIVTSPELIPLRAPTHQWSLVLVAEIATAGDNPSDPPRIWDPVAGSRIDDHTLVVADQGPDRLVIIRDGNVVARFAPRGAGPGEIRAPGTGLAIRPLPGGEIAVAELWANQRVHRFDRNGELIDDIRLERFASRWSVGRSVEEITVQVATPGEQQGMPFGQHVRRLNLRTGDVDHVLTLRPTELQTDRWRAFAPSRTWTAFADGSITTMRTDEPTFSYYNPEGRLIRQIHLPLTQSPTSPEIVARMEAEYPQYPITDFAPLRTLLRRLVTVDDSVFALEHTWISSAEEDAAAIGDEVVWRLVSTNGVQQGVLRFPLDYDPWTVENDRVLGVLRDSLGVATIQEYRLVRPDANGPSI